MRRYYDSRKKKATPTHHAAIGCERWTRFGKSPIEIGAGLRQVHEVRCCHFILFFEFSQIWLKGWPDASNIHAVGHGKWFIFSRSLDQVDVLRHQVRAPFAPHAGAGCLFDSLRRNKNDSQEGSKWTPERKKAGAPFILVRRASYLALWLFLVRSGVLRPERLGVLRPDRRSCIAWPARDVFQLNNTYEKPKVRPNKVNRRKLRACARVEENLLPGGRNFSIVVALVANISRRPRCMEMITGCPNSISFVFLLFLFRARYATVCLRRNSIYLAAPEGVCVNQAQVVGRWRETNLWQRHRQLDARHVPLLLEFVP